MTVAMLAVTLVMALALCLALVLAAVIVAEHRATSAADLGSLAAASALEGGQPPAIACARAAALVRRNRATMLSCTPDVDGSVQLWVACRWSGGLAGLGPQTAQARSRAGPG